MASAAPVTHNDLYPGDKLSLAHRNGVWRVLQVLDGYNGIQVWRGRGSDPIWVDLAEVKGRAK